jgi:ADP-ribose pyrophosphatase YjhB (NUDIX family)
MAPGALTGTGGGVEPGETIEECAKRELLEETGLEIDLGRQVLVCEAIDPEGSRHVLKLYFRGEIRSGALTLGAEEVLAAAEFRQVSKLRTMETYPPVGDDLAGLIETDFAGGPRFLGNVWSAQPSVD